MEQELLCCSIRALTTQLKSQHATETRRRYRGGLLTLGNPFVTESASLNTILIKNVNIKIKVRGCTRIYAEVRENTRRDTRKYTAAAETRPYLQL